jgi:glycosyltransferase involved in cell wall biosynthesis
MKITLIGPTYPFRGGLAHHTTLLCRALRRRHEVLFISFSRQYPRLFFPGRSDIDPSREPLTADPVERLIDSMNPVTWVRAARKIARFSPAMIVIPWWVTFWAPLDLTLTALLKRRGRPEIVFLCHNVVEHERHPFKAWITRLVLRQADRVVIHSQEEAARARALLGPRHKRDIMTGFVPTYAPLGGQGLSREEARAGLGLAPDRLILLFFGFVRPYKGLDLLIDALAQVRAGLPVELLVVGEFWDERRRYERMIERLGLGEAVRIVDRYVPNEMIEPYFAAADLVVQPYRSLSGSAVCQLAYGLGRPVIATDVGSLSEVIEDGVNGRLVPAGDASALAVAIRESLDPRTLAALTLGARATPERFTWDRLADLIAADPAGPLASRSPGSGSGG